MSKDIEKLKMISVKDKVFREVLNSLEISDPDLTDFLIDRCLACKDEDEYFLQMNKQDESFTFDLASAIFFIVRSAFPFNKDRSEKELNEPNSLKTEGENFQQEDTKEALEQGKAEGSQIQSQGLGNALAYNFPGLTLKDNAEGEINIDYDFLHEIKLRGISSKVESGKLKSEIQIKEKDGLRGKKQEKKERRKRNRSSDSSSSSSSDLESKKSNSLDFPVKIELNKVYRAKVLKVLDFGLLIQVALKRGNERGLVHISSIKQQFIKDLRSEFKEGDRVFAKLAEIKPSGKLSFTMRYINQQTGETETGDTQPTPGSEKPTNPGMTPETLKEYESYLLSQEYGPLTGIKLGFSQQRRLKTKNEAAPDVWEKTR